ncbi:hypothetical protein BCR35DRAFT_306322 [Leucosporidium creatinivorum]|uniref:Protein CPL1-like domain-containing protein n=1 Tax=Leucosporidium creatinivorum TaxID=106004 RepID=A0A1Y2EUU4_9BASI|nr:hypothetical protein BCR35DRAFT_306322 [Leucosporidium creatinivorum]
MCVESARGFRDHSHSSSRRVECCVQSNSNDRTLGACPHLGPFSSFPPSLSHHRQPLHLKSQPLRRRSPPLPRVQLTGLRQPHTPFNSSAPPSLLRQPVDQTLPPLANPLNMLRLSLVSALAIASAAQASVISTSVFPNSACAGASSSLGGLVGVGRVTLSNGEVETHCGCPSDNLPSFEACPSSDNGESVCNSVLDLESGAFTASCGVIACQGTECPSTVVNTVVVDETDCSASDKGAIGISNVDGEEKCACSADAGEFTACPTPENGRASCVATDSDFLGMAYTHKETVKCGVVCDDGFFLSPGGSCVKLAKRVFHSPGPIKVGPSASKSHSKSHSTSPTQRRPHTPTHTHTRHSTPGVFTTSSRSTNPPSATTTSTKKHHGSSKKHHHHKSTTDTFSTTGPIKVGPSASFTGTGPIKVGPSQIARRAVEEIVFQEVCAQDERSCPAGEFGDFSCVRLDDVTECGGCNSLGDAVSCLDMPGVASAACLRGGCVVRACQTGYVQTSEGTCSPKA